MITSFEGINFIENNSSKYHLTVIRNVSRGLCGMKLVRYGGANAEKPGLIDPDGNIRDLSAHIPDIDGSTLNSSSIDRLREINVELLPIVLDHRD